MEQFVYNHAGEPVGFCLGPYVFTLSGRPIGQLHGTHVYRLDGTYVGELHNGMVVNRLRRNPGGIGPSGDPGPVRPPAQPSDRAPANDGYPDVFDRLAG